MPDGLPLAYRAMTAGFELSVAVEARFAADGAPAPVRVYLAIPPRSGALDVPSTTIRRYENLPGRKTLDEVTGIATYSNYRTFTVATDLALRKPQPQ